MKLKHIITFVALSVLAGAAIASDKTNKTKEALDILESESKTLLLDVRTEDEFKSGTFIGAKNIPVDRILWHLDELKKYENIVVFCHSGRRSAQAQQFLETHGFINVYNAGSLKSLLTEQEIRDLERNL